MSASASSSPSGDPLAKNGAQARQHHVAGEQNAAGGQVHHQRVAGLTAGRGVEDDVGSADRQLGLFGDQLVDRDVGRDRVRLAATESRPGSGEVAEQDRVRVLAPQLGRESSLADHLRGRITERGDPAGVVANARLRCPVRLVAPYGLCAEPRRALVRRTEQPQAAQNSPPQRHRTRTRSRHSQVDQRMEQEPETVRIDQDHRRDPRNPRRLP